MTCCTRASKNTRVRVFMCAWECSQPGKRQQSEGWNWRDWHGLLCFWLVLTGNQPEPQGALQCPPPLPSLIVLHTAPEIELIFCKLDLWITQCDSNKCLAENGFQSHSKWKLLQSKRAFLCLSSSSSPSWLCVWVYMGWIWIHFLGNWIDTVMHEGSATLLQRADGLSDWIG